MLWVKLDVIHWINVLLLLSAAYNRTMALESEEIQLYCDDNN